MKKALITGGAGFIGSALVRTTVLTRGWQVVTLDALTYAGHTASLGLAADAPNHRLIVGDVADRSAVDTAFAAADPDLVFHLAAETHFDRSIDGAGAFVRTNLVGTHTMLEAALAHWRRLPDDRRQAFRFVHISTDEVFGSLGPEGAFHEATAYDPRSPYSASKAGSDHLVAAFFHTHGLPALVSNCSNNYGPRQLPEKLIPLMILNALEGRPLPVYGDGMQVRDWLHVEDHVDALLLMAERAAPGAKYCVGGNAERANIEIVRAVCAHLDTLRPDGAPHARLVTHVADRPGHDRRYAIDASLIRRELGWEPQRRFEDGLAQTVRWYLENPDWWAPLRSLAERRQGLAQSSPDTERT